MIPKKYVYEEASAFDFYLERSRVKGQCRISIRSLWYSVRCAALEEHFPVIKKSIVIIIIVQHWNPTLFFLFFSL